MIIDMRISFSFLEQKITHNDQELQELHAKIRALEAKRANDSQDPMHTRT